MGAPILGLLLIIGTITTAGCERKVVREEYRPMTGLGSGEYRPSTGLENKSYESQSGPPTQQDTAVRPPIWETLDQNRVQTSPPPGTPPP